MYGEERVIDHKLTAGDGIDDTKTMILRRIESTTHVQQR